jgi:glycosyltransferase involved in cell wall biosynthesis
MIVRNEAPVIERCLRSLLPIIDYWVICDTGSSDGTQEIIKDFFAKHGKPGELHERSWKDFAHNRTEALALSREKAEYCLIIDADDALQLPENFQLPPLTADVYYFDIQDTSIRYQRKQLVRNALVWRYKGVLHEYLESEGPHTSAHLPIMMRRNHDGARRRDAQTYERDASILERALLTEEDPFLVARYTLYLAQSYRDCGQKEKALENYLKRAQLGFWEQEVFESLYRAAQIKEELGHDSEEVMALYLRASEAAPNRVEAQHRACRMCRIRGENRRGYEIGKRGLHLQPPADGLFVETWVYEYGLRDEFAVNAYWAERYRESLEASLDALACKRLPEHDRERIIGNARFAFEKLDQRPDPSLIDILVKPAHALSKRSTPAVSFSELELVTVITPTRNRSNFLRKASRYFQTQDYPNLEWLILDDSTEPSPVPPSSAQNVFYEHVDQALSIGEKRNLLIERARGEIIVQFDDDDFYSPHYVSSMVKALKERQADLLNLRAWFLYDVRSQFFGYWDLTSKEGPHYRCDGNGVSLIVLSPENNADFQETHYGFGFSFVFKKDVWRASKFPDANFDEDGRFSRTAREQFNVDGIADDSGLCLHYLHEGSSSCCFPQHNLPPSLRARLFANAL